MDSPRVIVCPVQNRPGSTQLARSVLRPLSSVVCCLLCLLAATGLRALVLPAPALTTRDNELLEDVQRRGVRCERR